MKKLLLLLLLAPLISFGQNNSTNQLDSVTFLEKHNNEIWSDGSRALYFRGLSSIMINPKKQLTRFVFSGFLKKELTKLNLYNEEGQFFWHDNTSIFIRQRKAM